MIMRAIARMVEENAFDEIEDFGFVTEDTIIIWNLLLC